MYKGCYNQYFVLLECIKIKSSIESVKYFAAGICAMINLLIVHRILLTTVLSHHAIIILLIITIVVSVILLIV